MEVDTEQIIPVLTDDSLDESTQESRETPHLLENGSLNPQYLEPQPPSQHALPKQDSTDSCGVPEMKAYKRRWYILIVFSALACHQCTIWNTWGPIASSVQVAYGWSDGTVAMMANWGTIMFVISVVPLSWFIEHKGLRPTCILVSGFILVGSVLRCCQVFITDARLFLASCHICSILNGIAGVTIMAAPPLISSLWFPQNERTTATSINQAGNMLGNGLSMLIGPALVMVNETNSNDTSKFDYLSNFGIQLIKIPFNRDKEDIKHDINTYMYVDAAIAAILFTLFCIYYPSRPEFAPTATSVISRTTFSTGIKNLVTNKDVLLVCFAYSLSQGIMGAWMSVIVFNLRDLNITDQEVGYIGLGSVIGQCFTSMLAGFFTDKLRNKMKLTLVLLLSISGSLFLLLILMCLKIVPSNYLIFCIVIIAATSLNYACCPLFFELCVEIAYPVSESLVGGFLTSMNNLVGIIFLFLFFIPNIGSLWINYLLLGSVVFSIPAVLLTKERYNRSRVDEIVNSMTQ